MTQPKARYRLDYLPPDFTITDLSLQFELDAQCTGVTASSQVKRLNPQATDLLLVGEQLELVSVLLDGQPFNDYQLNDKGLTLHNVPDAFCLTISNKIFPAKNSALEGLYQSGEALCTQCEAEGFRRITYYLDRPDVLARFHCKLTADKQQYPLLLSNGNRIAQGELDDGRHWVEWQDPFPKPSYLFALVAGDFDVLKESFVTKSGRTVALELYVDKGNLDRAGWAMTSLKNAMRWDEQRFNLEYDLDIYMIVAVDFFNMGAMENKGLNIFNSKFVLAKAETATDKDYLNIESVIGHEYFHNWTGNRITCRDWFQLSLKEGLTVFRDQEFSSDLGSRAVNRIENVRIMRSAQFAEDASPMAHPIRPEKVIEMNNFYTMTVYEKGAEVIRMLHTLLGEAKFQAGMQLYIQRHDGCAVTCDDFIQAMQDASAIDLTLFKRWYSQSGTPQLVIRDEFEPNKQQYTLHVEQYTRPTADQKEKLPLHIPLNIELYADNGEVIPLQIEGERVDAVLNITEAKQQFVFENVRQKPIISLLRDFSAPVKVDYQYSDNDLVFLMSHARNDFARWDAAQTLIGNYIKLNIQRMQFGQDMQLPQSVIDAFRAVILSQQLDPALISLIITLPSEMELAELFECIDPDAIHRARNFILTTLAQQMDDEFLALYVANQSSDKSYQITQSAMAKRALKNSCLQYLALARTDFANNLVKQQYRRADNMTDTLAALTAAVMSQLPCQAELMADFAAKWQHDGLVMDKWFTLQATSPASDVLSHVNALMQHPTFSLNNPNRVRGLIGAFVNANPRAFHCTDGRGYQFLTDILMDLNQRNPQIAARLIEPLIRFKRYDIPRQQLMVDCLLRLKALDDLSGDLFEKIIKALENE